MKRSFGTDATSALRAARLDDIPDLIELFTAVVDERTWLGTEPGFDRERIRAGYARTIGLDDYLTLVAEVDDALAGTLRLTPQADGHGLGMLVGAGYRALGIGTLLLDAAIAWASVRNIAKLTLGVFPHNAAALRLYEQAGFCIVARRAAAYARQTGDTWDIIEMEKRFP